MRHLPRHTATLLLTAFCFSAFALSSAARADDKPTIALVEIDGPIASRAKVVSPLAPAGPLTLRRLTAAIDSVAHDPTAKGLLIRLREAEISLTQAEEIGAAMARVRAAGKKVHLYAYGYGTTELVLGTFADEIIAQAGGGVSLPGLYAEEIYLADALAWAGLRADMVQVGDYKGAAEAMANSRPSPQWNENIDGLLDSMYARLRAHLKRGRSLDDAGVDRALDTAWSASADDARRVGLVDTVLDLPDLSMHLEKTHGKFTWGDDLLAADSDKPELSNPLALMRALIEKPDFAPTRDSIAILHLDGAIVDGDSGEGGLLGGESSVGSLTMRRALATIENDDHIKGLIVRIESPGGSAIASEVIWQGVRRVADKGKKVWISVGSMAASGGYYILSAGEKVYVCPSSIVGSIGVVGGKIATDGLFKMLKLNVVSRARGPRAAMEGSTPWTDTERGLVRAKMKETYDLFASRVSAGRKGIDLSKTAEGRLFTADRAIELNMADAIGGLDAAIADMAKSLSLEADDYDVLDYPEPMTLGEMLANMLDGSGMGVRAPGTSTDDERDLRALSPLAALARQTLGPVQWNALRAPIAGLLQLRNERVLLMPARVIIVR